MARRAKSLDSVSKELGADLKECSHPQGLCCIANVLVNKCVALSDTDFGQRLCPFYRDMNTMTDTEQEFYEKKYKKAFRPKNV